MKLRIMVILVLIGFTPGLGAAEQSYRIVFGSFQQQVNADRWAQHIAVLTRLKIGVQRSVGITPIVYRVTSSSLSGESLALATRKARDSGMPYWRLPESSGGKQGENYVSIAPWEEPQPNKDPLTIPLPPLPQAAPPKNTHGEAPQDESKHQAQIPASGDAPVRQEFNLDLGLQSRFFANSGINGQNSALPSVSALLEYRTSWNAGRDAFTFSPFIRLEAEDGKRSHADIRELYWNRVSDDWELNVGFQQVFWGVTEFNHLVDIINQTDFVEDIDDEEKLGQPMINLSLVRNWGILDFMLLTGFRERTFPGDDGRLGFGLLVDKQSTTYASAAGKHRLDGAVRWSHYLGPVVFGVYHFSGTNRDPQLDVYEKSPGQFAYRPHYTTIDQTGFDAQVIVGDWVYKIEAISRSGDGQRFQASTFGFEKSIVGFMGTRADLGLVAEYMYDDRGAEATTIYEHDLALGTRWSMNDTSDTQALMGLIWDTRTRETIFSLEASRRLGERWKLNLEGRAFGGGTRLPKGSGLDVLEALQDLDNKSAPLQRDDYIQLELTRYL